MSLAFDDFDIDSHQVTKLNSLIKSFESFSTRDVSTPQVRLFLHCAGAIFGATYEDDVYEELVDIAEDLIIKRDKLRISDDQKFELFKEILSKLIYTENDQAKFSIFVITKINDRDNQNISIVDKVGITSQVLLEVIQSNTLICE